MSCLLLPVVLSVSDGCPVRCWRTLLLFAAGGGLGGLHLVLVGLFAGVLCIAIKFSFLVVFSRLACLCFSCPLLFGVGAG